MSDPATDDLRPWGYAPGSYMIRCVDCPPGTFYGKGDKRAWRCPTHALVKREEAAIRATQPPLICDMPEVPHA